VWGGGAVPDLLLGDLLFHAPSTLGPRAEALGISCQSCHPNGATNTRFSLDGVSGRPGTVDLSTRFFRPGAEDGIANPVDIPSLRGARFTGPYGHDGRTASLAEFVATVITGEFGGKQPEPRKIAALVRYVQDLDFLPNENLDERSRLTEHAGDAAHRGEAIFNRPMAQFGGGSCASCHVPSTFFRDGRVVRMGTGAPPTPHALDDGVETPSLLGTAETKPYFHDGRFASLGEVVGWFDASYRLGLSAAERDDLTAYVEAVGAVDRRFDDRPIARRLAQSFAYVSLTSDADEAVRVAAIDLVLLELMRPPAAVSARAMDLRARLTALRRGASRSPISAGEARSLRRELTRLAADWAGALAMGGR